MGKTYRNFIKRGRCYGSNTEFYKLRRGIFRSRLHRVLTTALMFEDPDDVFVHPEQNRPYIDRWTEPTQGHDLIDKSYTNPRSIEKDYQKSNWSDEWQRHCERKWYSKLKNKHGVDRRKFRNIKENGGLQYVIHLSYAHL